MTYRLRAIFLMSSLPFISMAESLVPYADQCAVLDKMLASSKSRPWTQATVLSLLERIALGKVIGTSAELELEMGLAPASLQQKEFGVPAVRAHAFRKIGEADGPLALEFLTALQRSDIGADSTQELWPAAHNALAASRLIRIT